MGNFIWTCSIASKKLIVIACDKCYCPKQYGGLGLKILRVLNEAMLSKLGASAYSAKVGLLSFLRSQFVSDVNLPRVVTSSV